MASATKMPTKLWRQVPVLPRCPGNAGIQYRGFSLELSGYFVSDVICHHYPQSPVSEKVRVVFGIKDLRWCSVEIPRIPPKPDLMPLTGGYRRTPVMQVGADVYCDSQCIIAELERRFPEPTLYPGGAAGIAWGVSRWTDGDFFRQAVGVVLGSAIAELPPEFAADRGRLYFGPDFDLNQQAADMPHLMAQLRGQLAWADQRLAGGRQFMLGDDPGLQDALVYYLVWFLKGRWSEGESFVSQFTHLSKWEARVRNLGHGEPSDMSSEEALAIAREAEPRAEEGVDDNDPQQLRVGQHIGVVPDGDGGDPVVTGELLFADAHRVTVVREDPQVGRIATHFPRIGYRVTAL